MRYVSYEQLDPCSELIQPGLGIRGVLGVSAVQQQIFVDEGRLTGGDLISRSDPCIVLQGFVFGEWEYAPQERRTNRHR